LAAAVGLAGTPVHSEEPLLLEKEAMVRVHAPSLDAKAIRGRVVSIDDETLILRSDSGAWERDHPQSLRRIPISAVNRIEVRGKTHGGFNAGLAGAIIGGGLGFAIGNGACTDKGFVNPCPSQGLIASLPGAAIGVIVGVALTRKTDWASVPLEGKRVSVVLAPTAGRGWKAGMSIAF
jgi:hypothetical protein